MGSSWAGGLGNEMAFPNSKRFYFEILCMCDKSLLPAIHPVSGDPENDKSRDNSPRGKGCDEESSVRVDHALQSERPPSHLTNFWGLRFELEIHQQNTYSHDDQRRSSEERNNRP